MSVMSVCDLKQSGALGACVESRNSVVLMMTVDDDYRAVLVKV